MNAERQTPSYFQNNGNRYFPRWQINNRILIRDSEKQKSLEALTKDLSCAGVRVESDYALTVGEPLKLNIFLEGSVCVNVNGYVVWQKKIQQKYQAGIMFKEISERNQKIILDHAFSIDRSQIIQHWFQGW